MELLSKMGPPLREDMEGSEETGLRHTALVVRSPSWEHSQLSKADAKTKGTRPEPRHGGWLCSSLSSHQSWAQA